jgi:3-deoxy-D-manno-octulosonate 8-phosphate phosphatase (KDO 8-P phosphatase)
MKKNIKILVMDVDGTLTDGKIYISAEGECMKAFNVKDGYAIHELLKQHGIEPVIITGRKSEIVAQRARELEIRQVYQGVGNKVAKIEELIQESQQAGHEAFDASNIAYIGDDDNDLPAIDFVNCNQGITGAPADAVSKVLTTVTYPCKLQGGNGAVREFIEWLIEE